jgi:beta-galactosidase
MVHVLPHWTHPGKEGVEIPVVVYTNGDAAELFYNGKSLGRKDMHRDSLQIVWNVPYRLGTIKAVAYKDGRVIASCSHKTAGKAYSLKLTADRKTMKSNRKDVVFVTVDVTDKKGNFVPYANVDVDFEVKGDYKLIGVENGDVLDIAPHKVLHRKTFNGKALLILQATDNAGRLRIQAKSPGLKSSSVEINVI